MSPTKLHYIAFRTLHETPLEIAARFRLPALERERHPAVIILHGSAGPTAREGGYADVLNEAGIATLEPDQWSPRGHAGGADSRPRSVSETLPDLYGAKKFLASHPKIDANRIGVMGFSLGGVAVMLAATRAYNDRFEPGRAFTAHMAIYPVCWLYNKVKGYEFGDLVDARLFIMTGSLDQYDNDPHAIDRLVASLAPADKAKIATRVMDGAHHGFDMPGIDEEVRDPSGNQGGGGTVIMRYNPVATTLSHLQAVEFFSGALG